MQHKPTTYDVLGIGFGPSNLALAIALDEERRRSRPDLSTCFLEKQREFVWHRDMLLPESDMQISFIKDLVTLRDPTSPFTFLNYLHERGRLTSFINLKSFFPSRVEFNDYLRWAAARFEQDCAYDEEVYAIEPGRTEGRTVTSLVVSSRTTSGRENQRVARNVVFALGGQPNVPPVFAAMQAAGGRVFHSSRYLTALRDLRLDRQGECAVAVIGGGQSAAETAMDLHRRLPDATVHLVFRSTALKPADDTPFSNEIFHPDAVDRMFREPDHVRDTILEEFRGTNYAVVDVDLLARIYAVLYQQQVEGRARLVLRSCCNVTAASADPDAVTLQIQDLSARSTTRQSYDAVVLATGYRRDVPHSILAGIAPYILGFEIGRDYRLRTHADFRPKIHVQGYSERTHGLSDTLLSILAIRSQEIARALVAD